MIVMSVTLKMVADIADSLRQKCNLNFGRTSVAGVGCKLVNYLLFGASFCFSGHVTCDDWKLIIQ